eukprot:TRINITY_DN10368_c0_g2_i1.p1 TRINITY_DN10368_c0_g2~~TRINITY_DN10368_c0_g2_i1.p1  ORF type:complete len:513 (+),score=60.24 TRINITY_DN10368_c0_g2_i1:52-1590(+)
MTRPARQNALDTRYSVEYDVGLWMFGTISVVKDLETGELRSCKTVTKVAVRSVEVVVPALQALRGLKHPHICSVIDVLEDKDYIYILNEFCVGGEMTDLIDRLENSSWLQEQVCIAYMRQALLALNKSHSANIFHRDLSPSSMHLTSRLPDAQVKVIDFGLAGILDPDNAIIVNQPSRYTDPQVLRSRSPVVDGSADLWSLGAMAHTLLIGRPPCNSEDGVVGGQWFGVEIAYDDDDDCWSERSKLSRDFVMQLLGRNGRRLTLACALQHPWIRGIQAICGVHWTADKGAAKETRHKAVCYLLSVLLLPVLVPFRDFEQLRLAFQQADTDCDGNVPRHVLQMLLLDRCQHFEAVDRALDIVDIGESEVMDLCGAACADLIARDFFGVGPSSQPLVGPFGAKDLMPRLLKRFFEAYADRNTRVTTTAGIRGRLRTATTHAIERHARVCYDDILASFPDNDGMDSQMLAARLSVSQGQGTPLYVCEESLSIKKHSCGDWGSGFGLSNFFCATVR